MNAWRQGLSVVLKYISSKYFEWYDLICRQQRNNIYFMFIFLQPNQSIKPTALLRIICNDISFRAKGNRQQPNCAALSLSLSRFVMRKHRKHASAMGFPVLLLPLINWRGSQFCYAWIELNWLMRHKFIRCSKFVWIQWKLWAGLA